MKLVCYNKNTKREDMSHSKRKEIEIMKNYRIYIKSDKNPRTINTPMMGRTYFEVIEVQGNREALESKVAELRNAGETITEICTGMGKRIWL